MYSQNIYLSNSSDIITQSTFKYEQKKRYLNLYAGAYLDSDTKTNSNKSYTDSQFSPLIGLDTRAFFTSIFPLKFFGEYRYVKRLTRFPDHRAREEHEFRLGTLGYDLLFVNRYLFLEHYNALFYSHLYSDKFIIQVWAKQGIRYQIDSANFDLFSQFTFDSYDLSDSGENLLYFRPGFRAGYKSKDLSTTLSLIRSINLGVKEIQDEYRLMCIVYYLYK